MVGWHHRLNGREFEQPPGDSKGQGILQSMGSQRVRQELAAEQLHASSMGIQIDHVNSLILVLDIVFSKC